MPVIDSLTVARTQKILLGPLRPGPDARRIWQPGRCWPSPQPTRFLQSKPASLLEFSGSTGCEAAPERRGVEGLRLFVPENTGLHLRNALLALSSLTRAEIFRVFAPQWGGAQTGVRRTYGNLQSRLPPPAGDGLVTAGRTRSRLASPASFRAASEENSPIAQHMTPGACESSCSFRGLDFARWSVEGLSFGLDDSGSRSPSHRTRAGKTAPVARAAS